MAHDVFLSYAAQDKPTADAVCARLEQQGIRCWIAPRDILPGRDWRTSIVEAIGSARALVLMLSAQANASSEVPKEILQATQHSLPIITFRIEDVTPSGPLSYELNSIHWLDALTKPLERHIDTLAGTLQKLLNVESPPPAPVPVVSAPAQRSMPTLIAAVAVTVVVMSAVTWWVVGRSGPARQEQQTAGGNTATELLNPAGSSSQPPLSPRESENRPADPVQKAPRPDSTLSTAAAIRGQAAAPVIGCWRLPGQPGIIVVRPDGTFVSGGVIVGSWKAVNPASGSYVFQFPDDIGYGELSADGRRLTNPATNEILNRVSGGADLPGVWRLPNGLILSVDPDGSAKLAVLSGRWKVTEQDRHMYEFRWQGARPTITISGDVMKYFDAERGVVQDFQRLPC